MARPVEIDEVWMARIAGQVNGLEYGSVLITVHDGRIVQIDRTERKRFDAAAATAGPPANTGASGGAGNGAGSGADTGRGIPFPRNGRKPAEANG